MCVSHSNSLLDTAERYNEHKIDKMKNDYLMSDGIHDISNAEKKILWQSLIIARNKYNAIINKLYEVRRLSNVR